MSAAAKRVGITGAYGMLGWHMRCRVFAQEGWEAIPAGRETFASEEALDRFAASCDVIVHLAGVNRASDPAEVRERNPGLARELVAALQRTGARPHVLYSSSTHARGDSEYGVAKREAGRILAEWAAAAGALYTELVLPHVFGEGGRPHYNSVVHTFCHQVVAGETPEINGAGQLELLHAGAVTQLIVDAVQQGTTGELAPAGSPITVGELWQRVQELHAGYFEQQIVPQLASAFDLALFNVYRSYLFPEHYPLALTVHADDRGNLFEGVRSHRGGQTFVSTTRPGITRGNHFHFGKVERFLVLRGEADIAIRRMFDDQVHRFRVSGESPVYLDMPTLHTHSITNTGDGELLTLFWAHEIFDPQAPDTIFDPVEAQEQPAEQA